MTVVTEGDGLVGVRPALAGALKAGDQVVTGENYLTSPLGRTSGKARLVPGGFADPAGRGAWMTDGAASSGS